MLTYFICKTYGIPYSLVIDFTRRLLSGNISEVLNRVMIKNLSDILGIAKLIIIYRYNVSKCIMQLFMLVQVCYLKHCFTVCAFHFALIVG